MNNGWLLPHITHFRVIGVPGGCLASSSLFLDEMFSSSYIHFDAPIKGGFCGLTELIAERGFYASVPQLGGYMRQKTGLCCASLHPVFPLFLSLLSCNVASASRPTLSP